MLFLTLESCDLAYSGEKLLKILQNKKNFNFSEVCSTAFMAALSQIHAVTSGYRGGRSKGPN